MMKKIMENRDTLLGYERTSTEECWGLYPGVINALTLSRHKVGLMVWSGGGVYMPFLSQMISSRPPEDGNLTDSSTLFNV